MDWWVLVQIVSPIFALGYVLSISTFRFSPRATYGFAAASLFILTLVNIFAVSKLYPLVDVYPQIDLIYRSFNISVVAVLGIFLNRSQPAWTARVTFGGLSVCLVVFVVDTIAITIRTVFGVYPMELLCELLLYPLMLFILVRLRKTFYDVTVYMKNRLLPLCFVPAGLNFALFMQVSYPLPLEQAPENIPVALMLCVVTFAAYGVIFYLFRTLLAQSHSEQYTQAMQIYVSALEKQNTLVSQNAQRAALFRHDLRHAAQMMSVCMESGDMEGLKELIGSLDENLSEGFNMNAVTDVTGHRLLDATLCYYMNLAQESGLEVLIDMEQMDRLQVDKTELAVVLSNALENAVCACKSLPPKEKREIRVSGRWHGSQFFLEIANTYTGAVTFDPDTGLPVSSKEGHGLGSQSIAFFAQKYGAALEYLQCGGWVYLRLLL